MEERFQEKSLNKKDHEKIDKGAKYEKNEVGALVTIGGIAFSVLRFVPKLLTKKNNS